ncbi:MAG: helix-turn-helix domain-containing protein, partial [Verrucomicrobiales bacterium]
ACARGGLGVPDEVAIPGVDNDESECGVAYPALSSVDTPSEKIGYQAARMLASLMEGRGVREERVFLPPLHIVTRSSTDRWASKDPFVRRALDFVRDEAGKRIQVEMVAKAAGVSRRQLERLFKRELRRTVLAVIHESKTALAKEMLAQTDYRVSEVAERSGFADAKRLNAIFKKSTGMSPREFRKRIGA